MEHIGKILIVAGIVLVIAGLIISYTGSKLGWIVHLPGDINIVKGNVRIHIPVTTMILFSFVLSIVLYIIRKLF